MLKDNPFELTYLPVHEAAERFPFEAAGLADYKVTLLSDIGVNTLLLPSAVWPPGKLVPNRLKVIRNWPAAGGGLAMIGGYFSFQGIDGCEAPREGAGEHRSRPDGPHRPGPPWRCAGTAQRREASPHHIEIATFPGYLNAGW